MMPMLLNTADRKMLTERVLARLLAERPAGCCTNDDLRVAIDAEAAALVAEGHFVVRDGTLIRRPVAEHDCVDGWIAVPDPILGGLVDERCPDCQP